MCCMLWNICMSVSFVYNDFLLLILHSHLVIFTWLPFIDYSFHFTKHCIIVHSFIIHLIPSDAFFMLCDVDIYVFVAVQNHGFSLWTWLWICLIFGQNIWRVYYCRKQIWTESLYYVFTDSLAPLAYELTCMNLTKLEHFESL